MLVLRTPVLFQQPNTHQMRTKMADGMQTSAAMAGRLSFRALGAAGTVTGSRHLLTLPDGSGLLIDYGLFQGGRELEDRNLVQPEPEVLAAGALVLTHAHLDHSGALPLLVRDGWQGTPYATEATVELCTLLLADSGRIQEHDADRNHDGNPEHPPLYTEADANAASRRFKPIAYHAPFSPIPGAPGANVTLYRAGHIPGSSLVLVDAPAANGERRRVLFSGDLGRYGAPILPDPEAPPPTDYIVLESTYGDRDHPQGSAEQLLGDAIRQALQSGGPILIPAFAVGRTQELLYVLRKLEDQGTIPTLPVYIDSPLASGATKVLERDCDDFDEEMQQRIRSGSVPLDPHDLRIVEGIEQSKALNDASEPMFIIAGSGMATGGRILRHLEHHLGDPRATVLFVGYQGEGTLGRILLSGAQSVRMFHHDVPVQAKIIEVSGLSAHADRGEMIRWLRSAAQPPRRIFLVHGEPASATALAARITSELGWPVSIPAWGERIELV